MPALIVIGLDVCYAPSQDGRLPEPASEMARVCRNDPNRLRLRHPRMSAIMGEAKVLGAPRSFLRSAFEPRTVCSSESTNRTFGALRSGDRIEYVVLRAYLGFFLDSSCSVFGTTSKRQ